MARVGGVGGVGGGEHKEDRIILVRDLRGKLRVCRFNTGRSTM